MKFAKTKLDGTLPVKSGTTADIRSRYTATFNEVVCTKDGFAVDFTVGIFLARRALSSIYQRAKRRPSTKLFST